MARVSAVIPAHNEEKTVGSVVDAANAAKFVDDVIVVDSVCRDRTVEVARSHGARIVRAGRPGKGQAMSAGVRATDAGVIVFLDADLLRLKPSHVDALVEPVLCGDAAMACGLFDRGPLLNPIFLNALPILTGERAIWREIFESLDDESVQGYKIEAALNSRCADLGLERVAFVCDGLWHRTKEKKYPNRVVGFSAKIGMLAVAVWSYLLYWIKYRLRRWVGQIPRRLVIGVRRRLGTRGAP
jgi:glycosyltransferase involved in cell wall biosynthesis